METADSQPHVAPAPQSKVLIQRGPQRLRRVLFFSTVVVLNIAATLWLLDIFRADGLHKAHVKYLEARLVEEAKKVVERVALLDTDAVGDDGLQSDERDVAAEVAREKRGEEKPDALLRESAAVLADAINLLDTDRALAARVHPEATAEDAPRSD